MSNEELMVLFPGLFKLDNNKLCFNNSDLCKYPGLTCSYYKARDYYDLRNEQCHCPLMKFKLNEMGEVTVGYIYLGYSFYIQFNKFLNKKTCIVPKDKQIEVFKHNLTFAYYNIKHELEYFDMTELMREYTIKNILNSNE